MQYEPWLQKKFVFDLPITELPKIVDRLTATIDKIEKLVKGLPEIKLIEKPKGKWSLKEHIGHLTDLEELHDGRIDDFKNKMLNLRAADLENNKTEKAEHNKTSIKDLLRNFSSTRNYFIVRLKGLSEGELSRSAIHPRLQKQMRPIDMAFFIAEHDDHHVMLMEMIVKGIN